MDELNKLIEVLQKIQNGEEVQTYFIDNEEEHYEEYIGYDKSNDTIYVRTMGEIKDIRPVEFITALRAYIMFSNTLKIFNK